MAVAAAELVALVLGDEDEDEDEAVTGAVDDACEPWAAVTVRVTVLVDAGAVELPDWLEPQPAISAASTATSAGAPMRMRPIAAMLEPPELEGPAAR